MQAYTYDTATRLPVAHTAVSSFTYNADNRLTFYAYDANNRLASVTCNTVTPYSYDAAYRLPFARSYVFGSYIDEPLRMTSAAGVHYYHANQIYSVAALTDSTGGVVERYTYDPYGKVKILAADGVTVRTASAVGNPWTFTGRRLDGETGLMYYRARMYSTELGRFISRDPIGYVDSYCIYGYLDGEPTLETDPYGYGKFGWLIKRLRRTRVRGKDAKKNPMTHDRPVKGEPLPDEDSIKKAIDEGKDVLVDSEGTARKVAPPGSRRDGPHAPGGKPHYNAPSGSHILWSLVWTAIVWADPTGATEIIELYEEEGGSEMVAEAITATSGYLNSLFKPCSKYCTVEVVTATGAEFKQGDILCLPCPESGKCRVGQFRVGMHDVPIGQSSSDKFNQIWVPVKSLGDSCKICPEGGSTVSTPDGKPLVTKD